MWAGPLSWSSIMTPRWWCFETCSYRLWLQQKVKRRHITLMLLSCCCYHAVRLLFFWIKQQHAGRTPIRYFLKTCLQFCVDGSYSLSSSSREMSHRSTYHNQHQLTKYTAGDHLCEYWREAAPAQTLVERLHGQSPQKNSVQRQTLFVCFRWGMTKKTEWHCRLVDKFNNK